MDVTQDTREYLREHLKHLAEIGVALTSEKNTGKILEMIINEAMDFARADAGTIYMADLERGVLRFCIIRNRSLGTALGGREGPIEGSLVPMYKEDGGLNTGNVSAHVAITKEAVNIPDVYEAKQFDFSGTREYDEKSGYRSKSMLVVPMLDHDGEVIGILQIINAMSTDGKDVVSFDEEKQDLVESLASQAAVALNNAQLIRDLEALFDSLITSVGMAIDEKSTYTGGHVRRVAELASSIGNAVTKTKKSALADYNMNEHELKELKISAWLHDLGKVTTPEAILNKDKKLLALADRAELIKMRYEIEKLRLQLEYASTRLKRQTDAGSEATLRIKVGELDEEEKFILKWNEPLNSPNTEAITRLEQIARERGTISEEELENLCVRKGTLTQKEREIVENHAAVTKKMLAHLKFPKFLSGVPEYAGGHHEMLDGSGYPDNLKGDEIPIQARILAVADIFEALTAKRPYKEPLSVEEALSILKEMADEGKLDPAVIKAAEENGVFARYAEKELGSVCTNPRNVS